VVLARIMSQATELWSRPLGKWLLGGLLLFVLTAVAASYLFARPSYELLGTFAPADAVRISQRLNEAKLPFRQSGAGYTFSVPKPRLDEARLLLAELELDPTSTIWAAESWKDRVSWSNTDFDKRRLWVEQMEANLVRSIRALNAVENARVQISVPTERPLYRDDERPPKASVMLYPKQGQRLTTPMVEAVIQYVAGAVEGLAAADVVVVDASRGMVVSDVAFKTAEGPEAERQGALTLMAVEREYQEHWQQVLRVELERVVGVGNVAVIVKPIINWDRVRVETEEYHGVGRDGKGVPISEQTRRSSAEGLGVGSGTTPAGTTPNAEWNVPSYPGAEAAQGGALSHEEYNSIINYLVNQTRTVTDKPGGAIEEIAVGLLINQDRIGTGQEQAMKTVVAMAMGRTARVEVAAMAFAPSPWEVATGDPIPTAPAAAPSWPYLLLAVALTLAGIGLFFLVSRSRRQALEPVFAGPETAMMGGIPVTDLDWAPTTQTEGSISSVVVPTTLPPVEKEATPRIGETQIDGDQFLERLGIDPEKQRIKEKVEKVARNNPEAVAGLLKTWIAEG
jgi:flagellar M-ring protein FliF